MVVSLQTAVRLRPPPNDEESVITVIPESKQVIVEDKCVCAADYVFSKECGQGSIYDACLVSKINLLFEGNDIYVLACGGCLSGKTHTLFELNYSGYEISYGLIPLSVHHIFNTLSRLQLHNYFKFTVYINFVEIINGEVNDLLSLTKNKRYSVATNNKGSKFINGIENILCRNVNEVFGCLKVGLQTKIGNRQNHEDCNTHTLFSVIIYQQWICTGGFENRVSKATFIDLGSFDSQVKVTQNVSSSTCSDSAGVTYLSNIISDISSERLIQSRSADCNSVLPALIKDAFINSASTLLLCCLSPIEKDLEKSLVYTQLVQQVKEQFNHVAEEPVYDSNTTTSSQELEHYTQQDIYISMATSQWMKLIVNAEGLFQKLSHSGVPPEAKQQIEHWLSLKQEYDECFTESPTTPFLKVQKSLECIEEVTESEPNSSSCLTSLNSEAKETNKDDESKIDFSCSNTSLDVPKKQDFSARLEELLSRFRAFTDSEIDRYSEKFIIKRETVDRPVKLSPKPSPSNNMRRRKTVLPGDVAFVLNKLELGEERSGLNNEVSLLKNTFASEADKNTLALVPQKNTSEGDKNNLAVVPQTDNKAITLAKESKHWQVDMIIMDLEGAHERIEELNKIIKIKEDFINEMIQNSSTRNTAKLKLQRKLNKLEEEYYKTRVNLARAEKAVKRGDSSAQSEIEKYRSLSFQYEKRLHDLELVRQLAVDSAKKVIELETSLFKSKKKLQKLLKQLKKEEELKSEHNRLERGSEIEHDLKAIEAGDAGERKFEEEKKLKELQESSQVLKEQLTHQRKLLEKRESFFKERLQREKVCSLRFLDCSLDSVDRSKVEIDGNVTEELTESLRHEIRNLRKTRDCLVEQRKTLDAKINKDRVFTAQEERKYLECDEAIDAIDAVIEYKNEIMFGHMQKYEKRDDWEQGDELLIERLMNLSHPEIRTLLTKYFQKVIDLRDSGHKLEQQIAEQDLQIEAQTWKIQSLSNALQQANIESERRLILVHREYQEKLHVMFGHYTGETSATSSVDPKAMMPQHLVPAPKPAITIPHESIRKLQGTPSALVTKTNVTWEKNKLVIQQQKTKKRSK